jgi:hypothetical protein
MQPGNVFRKIARLGLVGAFGVLMGLAPVLAQQALDPLPSWNEGPAKQAIAGIHRGG